MGTPGSAALTAIAIHAQDPIHVRVAWVKAMIRTKEPSIPQAQYLPLIQKEFKVPIATACILLARAQREIGNAEPITKADFSFLAVNTLMETVAKPEATDQERRRALDLIAKIEGFHKTEPTANAPAPPNLDDDAVRKAALALDEAIENAKESP